MSQFENKIDDFVPFGGKVRTEYQEDEVAIPIAIDTAVINALDDIMFPMDDRGERPLECQTHFAVQRTFGAEEKQDFFLLSDAEGIGDEIPFSRDGASWGQSGDVLALMVYSEPPALLTFRELTPGAVDSLRDEDGLVSDAPSVAVEKVFDDPLCTVPATLTLAEVEMKVDAAVIDAEMERDSGESLDELAVAKVEESSLDQHEDVGMHEDQNR